MRQLPKYAILTSSEISGVKIISLEHPYIIASVNVYKRDDERASHRLEDMAQGRYPIAKMSGYTIFLTMFTSLEPCNNKDLQQAVLNDMVDFYYEDTVANKPGAFMKSEESGKLEKRILRESEHRKRIKKESND